jgi:hypothetical protein
VVWCLLLLELINHNDDLKQLLNEGYEIEFFNIYLMIHHVPYVNDRKQVAYGTLVSKSEQSGHALRSIDHTALWIGNYPCDSKGIRLVKLGDNRVEEKIREGSVATLSFSQKPNGGYLNYHHKMTQYIKILENEARAIDPKAKATTFHPVRLSEEESVFCYLDTASSRVGITSINKKMRQDRVAIVGLGGTGSYILDLVAKTPVGEIHLFDGDAFHNHNAFRSPGAPSYDDLSKNTTKVERFAEIYSRMRRKIIPHPQLIDESNIAELNSMNTVFLCVDNGKSRRMIVNHLIENRVSFIDVGISLLKTNEKLDGLVRVTTCTPSFHTHVADRIPFGSDEDDEYSSNIQIADMNMLNAALAVIKWKKMCGFYLDIPNEHNTVYGVSMNIVTNDETADEA